MIEIDEDLEHELILKHAKMIKNARIELETELDDKGIPPEYVTQVVYEVNKDLRTLRIQEQKQMQRSSFNPVTKDSSYYDDGKMTDNQRKAVFVITHNRNNKGEWISNEHMEILNKEYEDWEHDMTFQDASDFIDKYGNKKKKEGQQPL